MEVWGASTRTDGVDDVAVLVDAADGGADGYLSATFRSRSIEAATDPFALRTSSCITGRGMLGNMVCRRGMMSAPVSALSSRPKYHRTAKTAMNAPNNNGRVSSMV
jgi:hypothetical protein